MTASFRYEPLRAEWIDQILEIEKRVHGAPWSRRSFENEVDHVHGLLVVALIEDQVVGYGGVWMLIDEAHITTLSVDEEHRRLGIGRELMNKLLLGAKKKGMLCSTLEVRAGNTAAIKLYEGMGYRHAGVRAHYYPDNQEDAIVMWLDDLEDWEP